MTLFFDYKVHTRADSVLSCAEWHSQLPFLAVASHLTQPLKAYVTVFDHLGEPLSNINELCVENNEISCIGWHPSFKLLIVGLYSGDIRLWTGQSEFVTISSQHSSPIRFICWSQLGSRLVTVDNNGKVIGWKSDSRSMISRLYECNIASSPISLQFKCGKPGLDVSSLAKKAVEGDESALDMFSAWRPKTGSYRPSFSTDNACFYVAAFPNKIYYVDENGNLLNVLTCENDVRCILYHWSKDLMVIVLHGVLVCQYASDSDGQLENMSKVKLNGVDVRSEFIWAGENLLACCTMEHAIRFIDIDSGDTFLLYETITSNASPGKQYFSTISYSRANGLLCGGTNRGNATIWKNTNALNSNCWQEIATCKLKNEITYSVWGAQHVAVSTGNSTLYILQEHGLCYNYNLQVCGVQTTANQVMISNKSDRVELNTDLKIVGVAVSVEHVAVWSGKTVAVYQLTEQSALNVVGTFSCECESLLIYEQSLIVMSSSVLQLGKLMIYTFQGTLKQSLDSDGQPIFIHLNASYLISATIIGMLQIWDLSRREAKSHAHPKDLVDAISDFGEVISIRVNCAGTNVSLTVANSNLVPVPSLYVWDIESDVITTFQFGVTENNDNKMKKYITEHHWDAVEPSLLVCVTESHNTFQNDLVKKPVDNFAFPYPAKEKTSDMAELVTLFVSKEHGIVVQDTMSLSEEYVSLLGVDIPHFIIVKKSPTDIYACVEKLLMTYFEELSLNIDDNIRKAIIKFSFSLSIGDLDNAFKAIRNISSRSVWTNLAKMCVKRKRLDVAKVCLGNMNDAKGVAILRSVSTESEPNVKLAALAIHLGMVKEAEEFYITAGRYDLLNHLYRNSNRWNDAVKIAEQCDRINLKNTYDAYGRFEEVNGNTSDAIMMYEKAGTFRKHVPRLLLHDPLALEQYVQKSKDPALMKWWAQYIESTGNMNLAMKYYQDANDYLSQVRILCFLENTDGAAKIAESSDSVAACYHLARHFESLGLIDKAAHFFTRSRAYSNAIRICKENGLDEQLWQMSLAAGQREKLEAAKYFENTEPYRAVMLYHRAGNIHKALHLATKYDLYEAVQQISTDLNYETDNSLLIKCADYFSSKENFDTAVNLLAVAKKFEEAVSLCIQKRVNLSEELADILTPEVGNPDRINILNQIAEYAFLQGDYHLATKKFTQAGNKIKAMKALLKSGDTEKIIFFSNVSREKEIYVMAANYLQTLDWQAQPEILKHIVNFYTKGKAPHLLANFYVACAQVEVDEYGNYEKSVGALNEASRCLSKDPDQYGQAIERVARKISHVKKFIEIRKKFEHGEDDEAMLQCRQLLNSELELVRKGDLYSLMIENLTKRNDWNSASQIAQEMKRHLPSDSLLYYIPKDTLQKLGIEFDPEDELLENANAADEVPEDVA